MYYHLVCVQAFLHFLHWYGAFWDGKMHEGIMAIVCKKLAFRVRCVKGDEVGVQRDTVNGALYPWIDKSR